MAYSQNLVITVIIGLAITSSYAEVCQQSKDSICECSKFFLWDDSWEFNFNSILYIVAYEDGSGFSLKDLVSQNESFIEATTDQNLTFFLNPCNNPTKVPTIVNATGNCDKGFMLCVYNKEFNNFTLLGSKENAAFMQKDDQIFMSFKKSNDK